MGPDCGKRKASILTPRQKPIAPPEISPARIGITDISGKEFDIAPRGFGTELGDKRWHDRERALIGDDLGGLDCGR
jgi:hypothetical protein